MSLTQADLARIDRAIASGELVIHDGNSRVEYRSIAELQAARAHIAQQLAVQASPVPVQTGGIRLFRMTTSRGD